MFEFSSLVFEFPSLVFEFSSLVFEFSSQSSGLLVSRLRHRPTRHSNTGTIVFPVHIDASHVYAELKAEFDMKSDLALPTEYLARLHDGFVLAVCNVDPVNGDVLGT